MPTAFPTRLIPFAAALALLSGAAVAQGTPPGTAPGTTDTPDTAVPEQPAPPASAKGATDPCAAQGSGGGGSLSGQLRDCGGVLTPPATADGDIQAPAPDPTPNTTPVIPPDSTGTGQGAT